MGCYKPGPFLAPNTCPAPIRFIPHAMGIAHMLCLLLQ